MKKFSLLLFVLLFAAGFKSFSQDVLYKADGTREQVKVTMVTDKEIQYKKFSNPDGPVYSVPKKDVLMITYQNGDTETINKTPVSDKQTAKAELSENFKPNLLTFNLFDVIYYDFTISYERILSSGTMGIKIPVGLGYAYNTDYYYQNHDEWVKNKFYSGVGINFYPTGQGKWRYFVGPEIRVGYGKMVQSYGGYYDEFGNWHEGEHATEGIYTKFYMNNGIAFTPVKNFCVSMVGGVGVRFFPEAGENFNPVMPTGYFSFNMSLRF